MGVSGSGKSTVGWGIGQALSVPFIDADELHPASNVQKMAAGIPLIDEDRWPWLALVGAELAAHQATGAVVACSALKRSYRAAIRAQAPQAQFVLLDGSPELLATRIGGRGGHFMPPALLKSQLATLERFAEDEAGIVVDIAEPRRTVIAHAVSLLTAGN
ncbi:Gluconokinase [Leifsonia rubra CMS 76R]|nr:Gluconokinase [Leifsonia rubra CMS 76R]